MKVSLLSHISVGGKCLEHLISLAKKVNFYGHKIKLVMCISHT